jgi:exosortase
MTLMSSHRTDRLTARHAMAALLIAALGVAATWPAWADIYHIAYVDEEYSHIFIVPLVALYLVWVRRMRFRHYRRSSFAVGPFLILAGWLIGSYGFRHGVQSFWHGGAVLVVLGCIIAVLGKNVLFQFFPAVLVLIFLIPVPGRIRQEVALPLQSWTARTAKVMFETLGIDAEVSGNSLSVNGTTVTVAEACNGLRMVFALIMVTFAFAFSLPLRQSVRALILVLSPIAAIVCNLIRTVPTVWMFAHTPASVADHFHNYAGWAMLPCAFLLLYAVIALLRWAMIPVNRFTLASQESA